MKFYGELGCGLETNCLHFGIVVINVRKKIRVFFILKIKKTFVNVIKNVTLFFTCF